MKANSMHVNVSDGVHSPKSRASPRITSASKAWAVYQLIPVCWLIHMYTCTVITGISAHMHEKNCAGEMKVEGEKKCFPQHPLLLILVSSLSWRSGMSEKRDMRRGFITWFRNKKILLFSVILSNRMVRNKALCGKDCFAYRLVQSGYREISDLTVTREGISVEKYLLWRYQRGFFSSFFFAVFTWRG